MAKDLSKILVIDLESTCTEKRVPGFVNEIIEIGGAIIDTKERKIIDNFSIMVQPEKSEVTKFCTKLTTITPEMVTAKAGAVPFERALQQLKKKLHPLKLHTWASYGDYDRRQFERQCKDTGTEYPFGVTHINVKNLAALGHGLSREVGMDGMLEHMLMPLEGTHHRGIDDAHNIARILIDVLYGSTIGA